MKILYAASTRPGAELQLKRFLGANENNEIKIAGYGINNIDWNLNALLNFLHPLPPSFEGDNVEIYYEQVKLYNPDLIISDLEPFTSYIGGLLNIRTWQVSPSLLYTSLKNKVNQGVDKYYSSLFNENFDEKIKNIIYNSEKNFVYSHFCDLLDPPALLPNFEWMRPYHVLGKESITCKHNMVAATLGKNKNILNVLNYSTDNILFTNFIEETYKNFSLKSINNISEYSCNLKNCNIFINSGISEFLSDAFYNKKFSWIFPDFKEENIINALLTQNFNLGKIIYDPSSKIEEKEIEDVKYNGSIKLLHEKINELCSV